MANALGRTTIVLDDDRFTITHGPLPVPFRRGLDVLTTEVRSFAPLPKPTKRPTDRWVAAGVQCDHGSFEVAPMVENDEANYLVRRLQQHLSWLRDEPVDAPT